MTTEITPEFRNSFVVKSEVYGTYRLTASELAYAFSEVMLAREYPQGYVLDPVNDGLSDIVFEALWRTYDIRDMCDLMAAAMDGNASPTAVSSWTACIRAEPLELSQEGLRWLTPCA